MTKEQFLDKWAFKYNVNYTTNPYFIDDLEAVIATEIEKVQLQPEQPSSQGKLDNSFDKERFERMFRAVIETNEATMNALKQLDAYYASKNN